MHASKLKLRPVFLTYTIELKSHDSKGVIKTLIKEQVMKVYRATLQKVATLSSKITVKIQQLFQLTDKSSKLDTKVTAS